MPTATLLLREATSTSLNVIVEKSQLKKPPLPEYDLQLNSSHLNLTLVSPLPEKSLKSLSSDEGFESDIDSLSLISSDDSFTVPTLGNVSKTPETDSANGSACSDTEDAENTSIKTLVEDYSDSTLKAIRRKDLQQESNENYDLVNCVCYSDVKFPNLLVFVIKQEALVFKFVDLEALQKFYTSFNALKAVANQKAYCKDKLETKFNLLQRTDHNGITHIEISREPKPKSTLVDNFPTTRVISINTPDNYIDQRILNKMIKQKPVQVDTVDCSLVKKWNSSENLLESAQKTERRKRVKGKAPAPPPTLAEQKQNVLKGEYVRVNVPVGEKPEPQKPFSGLGTIQPKLTTYQQFKYSEPKRVAENASTLTRSKLNLDVWTNSVPRMAKTVRSRSETRNFTPMAYRYIDTTSGNFSPIYPRRYVQNLNLSNAQISNRLFGMSHKLRDFSTAPQAGKYDEVDSKSDGRWSSLSELSQKMSISDANLKSVIKKEDNKRKNEKKVTFSAYTTVQVV